MITVEPISQRDGSRVRVRFTMPGTCCCGCLYLVGWFEEWHESVYRMQLADDGQWSLILELEAGCEYQYCFRTDDGRWLFDPDMPVTEYALGSKNCFVLSHDAAQL